jgi:DNA-binding transcriptional ArsR family regulator
MFENSPAIDLAVGRSSVRQRILALLMDDAGCRLHLREIQRRAGTSPGTASRELAKLVAAGLIDREAEGNQVYFRASASPLAMMLRSLLLAMPAPEFGPRPPRLPLIKSAKSAAVAATPVARSAEVGPPETIVATDATPRVLRPRLPTQDSPSATDTPPAETASASATATETETAPATTTAPTAAHAADPLGLQVAGRLAESIRSLYGDALRGTYLYGSRATGPAPADADVEMIIVLDRVDHYGAELERTSHLCAALSHEWRLVVSRVFVSEANWNGSPDGAPPAIRAEAVAV